MKALNILFFIVFALMAVIPFSTAAAEDRYDVPVDDSPSWGPVEAPVTIIEFIDYQ